MVPEKEEKVDLAMLKASQEMGALVAPRQSCKGSQSLQGCASQRQGAGGVWEKQGINYFGGLWFVHSGKLT